MLSDPRGSLQASKALVSFEDAVGGRARLIAALELASLTEDQSALILALADPSRKTQTLASICGDLGLRTGEVLDLFRTAAFAKAHAVSMGIISEELPNITQDVVDKAVDSVIPCPLCRPHGYDDGPDPACPRCKGEGEIKRLADFERQKMIFESAGLLKKGGGTNINVNTQQNVLAGAPSASFSKVIKALDAPSRDIVIDAEVESKDE